jgi:hypothetical protein
MGKYDSDRVLDCCEVAQKSAIVVLHEGNWAIEFSEDCGFPHYFPINFCPWCGNKLVRLSGSPLKKVCKL